MEKSIYNANQKLEWNYLHGSKIEQIFSFRLSSTNKAFKRFVFVKTDDVPILTLHTLLGAKLRVGDEIKNFWSSHVLNSREGEKICRFESILTNNFRSNGAKYHWSWIP